MSEIETDISQLAHGNFRYNNVKLDLASLLDHKQINHAVDLFLIGPAINIGYRVLFDERERSAAGKGSTGTLNLRYRGRADRKRLTG
ncbi:hypothetical protein D3C83_30390 [compost metagenome]